VVAGLQAVNIHRVTAKYPVSRRLAFHCYYWNSTRSITWQDACCLISTAVKQGENFFILAASCGATPSYEVFLILSPSVSTKDFLSVHWRDKTFFRVALTNCNSR
jgi:hypothetical protein